jgi:hypothetical protein
MADSMPSAQSVERGYEIRDAAVSGILLSLFGVCLLIAFALFGSDLLVAYFAPPESRTTSAGAGTQTPRTPEPRLQIDPGGDLVTMRRAEDVLLRSYGWIDRPSGTVRIPIDRAMDLLAAEQLGPQSLSSKSPNPPLEQHAR